MLNDLLNLFNADSKDSHAIFEALLPFVPLSNEAASNPMSRSFTGQSLEAASLITFYHTTLISVHSSCIATISNLREEILAINPPDDTHTDFDNRMIGLR